MPTHPDYQDVADLLRKGSGVEPTVTAELYYQYVPRIDLTKLRLAVVPHPPQLAEGTITNEHAIECALWLRAWVERYYGMTCRWNRRSKFDRRRTWKAMREGMELLRRHNVSPARWAAFIGQQAYNRDQFKPPPVTRVFGRGMVEGQLAFGLAVTTTLGGQLCCTPKYSDLCKDYSYMVQDLRLSGASDAKSLRAVVAQYFPGDSFRRRVAAVAMEADAQRAQFDKALLRYEWIW